MDWSIAFEHLCKYVKQEGHARIPKEYVTKDGFKLGAWVARQRAAYKAQELSSKARRKLEQLPGWIWDIRKFKSEKTWFKCFEYLCRYVEQEGHARVHKDYVTGDGFKLGAWVASQRAAHKDKELSSKARRKLEQLPGWIWDIRKFKSEKTWFKCFEYLCRYVDRERHASVPKDYVTEDGFRLGAWVVSQRSAHKAKELSSKATRKLEQLPGWIWDTRKVKSEKNWFKCFEYLCRYAEQEGHAKVPIHYLTDNGYHLGAWVQVQRQAFRRGQLPLKRRSSLNKLPGWTWDAVKTISQETWNKGFANLREYVKNFGDALVPTKYVTDNGYKLGAWVNNQRQTYKRGIISRKQGRKLERLKGWVWDAHEVKWMEYFKYLVEYIESEGNALVPRRYVNKKGCKLGLWVMAQRQLHRQGRLHRSHQEALAGLPGWYWDARGSPNWRMRRKWFESFELLRKYVKKEGHGRVPRQYVTKKGYKLGAWVGTQRYKYKRGQLPSEQQAMLEKLPGWVWDGHERLLKDMSKGWLTSFERLRRYVEQEGHACVPAKYTTEDGYKLGTWVIDQRYEYKKGRLSLEQQEALEQLPGWVWNAQKGRHKGMNKDLSESWLESLKRLREYVGHEGNARVPSKYISEDGYRLGTWVRDQRYEYKKGRLSVEQRDALMQLSGWAWNVQKKRQTTY